MVRKDRRAKNVFGTKDKPRLAVKRSLKNIYAQIINDEESRTIAFCSTIKEKGAKGNVSAAKKIGLEIAKKAKEAGIKNLDWFE